MAKKLTDITTSYSTFAKDQILTESQLNEFLEYFDEQDRLSRICLSGVGIACGFELSTNSKTNAITISKGAGVTTDGDLIHLVAKEQPKASEKTVDPNSLKDVLVDSIKYEYYREYESDEVKYHPHFNLNDAKSKFDQIPLIEIVSSADKRPTDANLQQLDLRNKVALFYLESYPRDPDTCVTVNCENQGIEQVNKLRVLLVDINHIDRITRTDNLFNSYITLESYLETKTVFVPRVILNDDNTDSASALAAEYQDTSLINSAVYNIRSGVRTILSRLDRSPEAATFDVNMRRLFPTNDPTNLILFQYKYDLLKDLADSYNELKELFLQQYATCCPNIEAFPKHLLLGRVYKENDSSVQLVSSSTTKFNLIDDKSYRHKFHKSPILLDSDEGNGRFESVLTRILTMVSERGFIDSKEFKQDTIRITPSNERVPLGKKAVPFYYRFNNELNLNWDFDKRGFDRYKSILGYHQASAYPNNQYVSNPLRFSIDPYDFYRIEGHQGYPYDDVFETLTFLKEQFSLPFDIKVLGINVTEFDELLADRYKCDFKDLSVLLKAWASEQECIATEVTYVLSSFSTKDPGKNTVENNYFDIKGVRGATATMPKTTIGDTVLGGDEGVTSAKTDFSRVAFDSPFAKMDSGTTYSKTDAGKTSYVNPVLSYINNEPDTVGFYLDQSIKDASGNYANALAYATNTLTPLIKEWEDDVAVSTVSLPLQILVACTTLIELIPNSINQLSDSTLDSYNIEIEKLCSYTKQLQTKYRDPNLEGKISDKTRSMVSLLVNQLTAICCSSKKLKALLEEVKRRKESIIERLNFKNFAMKNPGLEHKAGAGPGQTFVVVYLNEAVTENTGGSTGIFSGYTSPVAPFIPDTNAFGNYTTLVADVDSGGTLSSSIDSLASKTGSTDKTIASTGDAKFIDSAADDKMYDRRIIDPNLFLYAGGSKVVIPKGTVIADFTLPYLCCSDCAPISFVLPKIPVSLVLSEPTYCIDDSNKEIDLTVTPNDGVVTVVGGVPGVNIENNKLSIDGSIFPDDLVGTIIKFKVDGEDTDAELLVSKTPTFDFNVPEASDNRVVSFEVEGDDHPDFTYDWDFGDGNSSTEREPTHDYSDSGSRTNFTVTLTVHGIAGICPRVVTHEVNFIDVTVSIESNEVCEGGAPIPFIVTPAGTDVTVTGQGVNQEGTHFDPALVGPGNYPLSYDGNVFDIVTVNPNPVVKTKITAKRAGTNLEFSIGTEFVIAYNWTFTLPDGKKRTSIKAVPTIPFEAINEYKPGQEITASVKVSNGCDSRTVDGVWVIPNEKDPTVSLEETVYCNKDKKTYEFITENFGANTVISGPGVNATTQPPTFLAAGLAGGEHDILVDGNVAMTVIIVEKPTMEIESVTATAGGFIATTTIPGEIDMSTVLWEFTDAKSGVELHPPIQSKSAVEVLFSDFVNNNWSNVKIVLSGTAGPCGKISDDEVYAKPVEVDVKVELPQYSFCDDDQGTYDFIFTPDNGMVTVSGAGVNTADSTFTPGGLAPASYILTASNGDTLSVTVVKKPTITIKELSATKDAFTGSTSLPAGVSLKSVVWRFKDPKTGETLHNPIFGSPNMTVYYDNFVNTEWTEVEITLSANTSTCGVTSDTEIIERATAVDVKVSLPRYLFCEGDKGTYDFIFDPEEQSMKVTGKGVNSAGTAFSPGGLDVGSYKLTAADGQQLTVDVVQSGIGSMNEPVYNAKSNTLTLSYTQIGPVKPKIQWNIGKKALGDLPGSDDPSYEIPLKFYEFKPGDTVLYNLQLTNDVCGEVIHEGSFMIPGTQNLCESTMLNELMMIDEAAPTRSIILKTFPDSKKVNQIDVLYALLADLIHLPSAVLSGQLNDRIAGDISQFIQFLEGEIELAMEVGDKTAYGLLLRLYRMAVGIYATAFRCQDGFDFKDFVKGNQLNEILISHFNVNNDKSLISSGVEIFNTTNSGPFIALLNEKGSSKEPWSIIDFIIKAKHKKS